MTFNDEPQSSAQSEPPPKDATMLVLMALIRALHEQGVLPAQSVADILDRRAVNAAMRGQESSGEEIVRRTAVAVQNLADLVQQQHPFGKGKQPPTPK